MRSSLREQIWLRMIPCFLVLQHSSSAIAHPRDTKPEWVVREAAHSLGLRYQLHREDLPGKPDLTFVGRKTIIFVNGCFWHQHPGCRKATIPKTNHSFWTAKLLRNRSRDGEITRVLTAIGWSVLVIWECQTKDPREVLNILKAHFRAQAASSLVPVAIGTDKLACCRWSSVDADAAPSARLAKS